MAAPSTFAGVPSPLRGMTSDRWAALTEAERVALRDLTGLTGQLVGLEGWRVEVTDEDGAPPRRFYVGRSIGWRPCHLEIARRNSRGGEPAARHYASVRKLYQR